MSLNTKCETGRQTSAPVEPAPMRIGSTGGRRSRMTYAVSMRRQSAEQQQKFMATIELFVSELVRQHLEHKEIS